MRTTPSQPSGRRMRGRRAERAGERCAPAPLPAPAHVAHGHEAEANAVAVRALQAPASEAGVRREVGAYLGFDFSGVRLHRDAAEAEAAGAHGVAVGADVYLAPGRFRPDHPLGRALLGHELTHVAQQGAAPRLAAVPGCPAWQLDAPASAHLAERAATLADPQSGLTTAPRGMRQRCTAGCDGGCNRSQGPQAPASLRASFRRNNSQLSTVELDKIERAVALAAGGNEALRNSFWRYFSSHEIDKASPSRMKDWVSDQYAETKPEDDIYLRPTLLGNLMTDERLATTLIHEYTHTRHDPNALGLGGDQEGDSYGIEFFFAERLHDTVRQDEIRDLIVGNPQKVTLPRLVPRMVNRFKVSYATIAGLYKVIDDGSPPLPPPLSISVFAYLTREEARALATELVDTQYENRSSHLQAILASVGAHLAEFTLPIP